MCRVRAKIRARKIGARARPESSLARDTALRSHGPGTLSTQANPNISKGTSFLLLLFLLLGQLGRYNLKERIKCSRNCARCDWPVRVPYSSIKHAAHVTRVLYRPRILSMNVMRSLSESQWRGLPNILYFIHTYFYCCCF